MAYPGDLRSNGFLFDGSLLEGHNGFEDHWTQSSPTGYLDSGNKLGTHVNSTTRSYIRSGNQYQVPPDVRFESGSPNAFSDYTHAQAHAYPSQINTQVTYLAEGELSPFSPSPSPFESQIYVGGHYTGSTPSLASSVSSPPTGRSANLLLTPESGLFQVTQLSASPNHFLSPGLQLTAERLQDCGVTPALNGLSIDGNGFQLAIKTSGASQQSSVLLGSTDGPQSSVTDLDPLDDNLVGLESLGGQTPRVECPNDLDDGGYSIHIQHDADSSNNRAIPVSFVLDNPTIWNPLLSPLAQLQGLPIGQPQVVPDYTNQVIIPSASWGGSFSVSQTASPMPNFGNTSPLHNRRPPPPVSSPSSPASESSFRKGGDLSPAAQQAQNFPELGNSPIGSGHEILQAAHSGKYPQRVVNPKGVSERTLAAAEANRKREAKFQCHICNNSQTSKQNLENHIASRHLQLKRFPCPFPDCTAKYGHARGVNRHLDSKHPGFRQASSRGRRGPSRTSQGT